jgi:predicted lipoprotein with Yx(FWY)xxD motif
MITYSKQLITIPQTLCTVVAMGMLALVSQACQKDNAAPAGPAANIATRQDAKLGTLLADGSGKTLYMFAKDVDGSSQCTGGCIDTWPVFYEKNRVFADGLDSTQFGVITRADGQKQSTFKGWPLYRFAQDTKAGDVNGEGKNSFYVAKPDYTVMVADKGAGKFLVGISGRTLYTFSGDTDDISNCKDGCLTVWPQFFAQPVVAPSTLNGVFFSSISRADGSKQSTANKKPLYYFQNDVARGDAKGNAANPKFSFISPAQ